MTRVRLQRFLAQAGVAARRKAEVLITEGRVRVNGKVVTALGTTVDPDSDRVQLDGQAVHPEELFYAILNKPKGTITAVTDPEDRRTVMEYVPNLPVQIAPVGRLDYYSEGLLLLTNDGILSAALQSPRTHVEKTYHVKLRGVMRDAHLAAMRRGVRLDDGTVTRPAEVDRLRADSKHDWLVITLTEGKSRQIHRMAEALGYQVQKLQRVAFGGLTFHGLRVGDARELTQDEVSSLRQLVGLPKDPRAVARGRWKVRREDSELARRAKDWQRAEAAAPGAGQADEARPAAPARGRERGQDRGQDRGRGPERDSSAGAGSRLCGAAGGQCPRSAGEPGSRGRRSPEQRRRSPERRRRSPEQRRRSPEQRRRSPEQRRWSPEQRRRAQGSGGEPGSRGWRSPEQRRRSPEQRRSAQGSGGEPGSRGRRSPEQRRRSPEQRRWWTGKRTREHRESVAEVGQGSGPRREQAPDARSVDT